MRKAYKLRHAIIDGHWRTGWLLSDTGQWVAGDLPAGYAPASAADWMADGMPEGRGVHA